MLTVLVWSSHVAAKPSIKLYPQKTKHYLDELIDKGVFDVENSLSRSFADPANSKQGAKERWEALKQRFAEFRQFDVHNGAVLQLKRFKSQPLLAKQQNIIPIDPIFSPRLSSNTETSTGFGVGFKINID